MRDVLLRRLAADASLLRLFSKGPGGELYPRVSFTLLTFLLRHQLTGNTRQLDAIVSTALLFSLGDRVEMIPDGNAVFDDAAPVDSPVPAAPAPRSAPVSSPRSAPPSTERDAPSGRPDPTREEIEAALKQAGGVRTKAARILGVERNKLYRIMRGLGMTTEEE